MIDEIASKYASALFAVAREENALETYLKEVKKIRHALFYNEQFIYILASYKLDDEKKMKILDETLKDLSLIPLKKLIFLIAKNGRARKIIYILDDFIHQAHLYLGIREGYIYSTYPLSEESQEKIKDYVKKKLGYEVYLSNRIDTSLIGGFKVVCGDRIIDMSIKRKLKNLKKSLHGKEIATYEN